MIAAGVAPIYLTAHAHIHTHTYTSVSIRSPIDAMEEGAREEESAIKTNCKWRLTAREKKIEEEERGAFLKPSGDHRKGGK